MSGRVSVRATSEVVATTEDPEPTATEFNSFAMRAEVRRCNGKQERRLVLLRDGAKELVTPWGDRKAFFYNLERYRPRWEDFITAGIGSPVLTGRSQ